MERDERFRDLVSILIASVAILTAFTAFLQTYASNQAAKADRRAQELSLLATTTRLTGIIQVSSDWQGVIQIWRELDLQVIHAQQEQDGLAEERYTVLRDKFIQLSPLLGPPYFDPQTNWPDTARYESDLYLVESTRLSEQFTAQAELGNAWDEIANAFVIQLTLLAVTLSLFGLSSNLQSWVRWLFLAVGSGLVLLNLVWMAFLLIAPLPHLPDAAIDVYAQGVGMVHQARDQEAVDLFTQALAIHPTYANAYYERAGAYFYLGNYEQAARDYEAAREAGRGDANLGWNLGWTYYLLGQFDKAILVNQHTLLRDPTLIGLRMNQGLALLAAGNWGNAEVEYTLALEEAARQVSAARAIGQEPPASLWFYMNAGAADLQSLIDTLRNTPHSWTQAPPASVIHAAHTEMQSMAEIYIKRIKEATTALEYTGQLPSGAPIVSLSNLQTSQERFDDQGNFLEYQSTDHFPYGTNDVVILFDYAGIQPGQSQIWKVYRNGFEDPSLRVVAPWGLEESGSAIKRISFASSNVFIFAPGEYVVDFYLDYHLMQSVKFFVDE
jgi:tetratricopeptide (TPR) repeat protein